MFASLAYAAAGAPGGAAGAQGGLVQLVMPIVLMFAVFYFLLIRPQQKRAKQHRAMLNALQKGDHVLTSGGLLGRIVDVENDILTLDLGDTKVRVPRGYVSGTYDPKALDKVAAESPAEGK
ncbi:MAG: preprotein translocase subunit YajC [Desulfovibrionaceae bacterium]|nr:preprotein translocase subunit YajC [Desulfovibrionaceae bacterium]